MHGIRSHQMSYDSHERATIAKVLRRNVIQIVIGLILLAAVCCGILSWTPDHGEEWIARQVELLGGTVSFESDRITSIGIFNKKVPSNLLAAIKATSTLKELWLIHTDFTDDELKQLMGVTGLKSLYLGDALVTDAGLIHLKSLTNLRILELNATHVTDSGIASLRTMKSLVWINLNHTQVTDTGLEYLSELTSLRRLYLRHTNVTDAGLRHLANLESLQLLDLDETEVSAEGRAMLRKDLPDCQIDPNP